MYLYHYTDFNAFKGIIKNREWWFGSFTGAKDDTELDNYIDGLQRELLSVLKTDEEKEKCNILFDKINPHNDLKYFISLTKLRENNFFWKHYANNSSGVCFVFNSKLLDEIFHNDCFRDEIFYRDTFDTHEHFKILYAYIKENRLIHSFDSETDLISNIQATACKYKHRNYANEEEIRFVPIFPNRLNYAKEEKKQTSNGIKGFLIIDIQELLKNTPYTIEDLISEIIIGSNCICTLDSIKEYLKENKLFKLAEKISPSKPPLE